MPFIVFCHSYFPFISNAVVNGIGENLNRSLNENALPKVLNNVCGHLSTSVYKQSRPMLTVGEGLSRAPGACAFQPFWPLLYVFLRFGRRAADCSDVWYTPCSVWRCSFRRSFPWLIGFCHLAALLSRSWATVHGDYWFDVDRYFNVVLWIGDALRMIMVAMLMRDPSWLGLVWSGDVGDDGDVCIDNYIVEVSRLARSHCRRWWLVLLPDVDVDAWLGIMILLVL